ncbi:unnamed protein product [Calicophoron daubneyi]|uniref:Uncharacterized protein n=1 Tax=Calicophoron daubneyi TaxID=300641 RepID=A0AAV2T1N0_CALDB
MAGTVVNERIDTGMDVVTSPSTETPYLNGARKKERRSLSSEPRVVDRSPKPTVRVHYSNSTEVLTRSPSSGSESPGMLATPGRVRTPERHGCCKSATQLGPNASASESLERLLMTYDTDFFENTNNRPQPVHALPTGFIDESFLSLDAKEDKDLVQSPDSLDIDKLIFELNHCRYELRLREKQIENIEQDAKRAELAHRSSVVGLTRERDDLARLVVQLRTRLQDLQEENRELFNQVTTSVQIASAAKEEQIDAENCLQMLKRQLEDTKSQFDQLLTEKIKGGTSKMSNNQADTSRAVDELRMALESSQAEALRASALAEQLEKRLAEAKKELELRDQESREAQNTELYTIEELRSKVSMANAQRDEAVAELRNVRVRLQDLEAKEIQKTEALTRQLMECKERIVQMETELLEVNESRMRLMSKLSVAERESAEARRDLQNEQLTHKDQFKQAIQTAKARESELLRRMSESQKYYEKRMEGATILLEQYRTLTTKLAQEYTNGIEELDRDMGRLTVRQNYLAKNAEVAKRQAQQAIKAQKALERETGEQLFQFENCNKQMAEMEECLRRKSEVVQQLTEQCIKVKRDRQILADALNLLKHHSAQNGEEDIVAQFIQRTLRNTTVDQVLERVELTKKSSVII